MTTEVQTERAFQRQHALTLNHRSKVIKKKKWGHRYYKDVGLGFRTPNLAKEGTYVDKKCPFTSDVHIRGRILKGVVVSTKMNRTIIVRRDYLHYVRKVNRYEKRHNNIPAHCSPAFKLKEGDVVTIGQCRPLSKTVRFNVLKHDVVPDKIDKKVFRIF